MLVDAGLPGAGRHPRRRPVEPAGAAQPGRAGVFTLTLDGGRTVEINRSTQQLNPTTAYSFKQQMVGDGIPYVYIPNFSNAENERKAVEFVKEHADAQVLIIDVRNKPDNPIYKRSVEDLKNGRDTVLERAIEMAGSADH